MNVRCEAVNYYTRAGASGQEPAVSITFVSTDDPAAFDQFTLNLINIEGPVEYFPQKNYTLNLVEVDEGA